MSRSMPMPIWVGREGPRVLIEASDFTKLYALRNILSERGYSVLTCGGPEATDDRCALVDFDHCDGVARADLVVHSMRPQDPRNREVLRAIRQKYSGTPVVVEAPRPYVEKHAEDFDGCIVVFQPMTRRTLMEAVDAALGSAALADTTA